MSNLPPPIPNYATATTAAQVNAMARAYQVTMYRAYSDATKDLRKDRRRMGSRAYIDATRALSVDRSRAILTSERNKDQRLSELATSGPGPMPGPGPGRIIPGPGPTDLPGPPVVVITGDTITPMIDPTAPTPDAEPLTGAPPFGPVVPPSPSGENAQYTARRGLTPANIAAAIDRAQATGQSVTRSGQQAKLFWRPTTTDTTRIAGGSRAPMTWATSQAAARFDGGPAQATPRAPNQQTPQNVGFFDDLFALILGK